jgi:hypothetical protein
MSTERKLKRGDVHPETGKVFWAYGKACLNGEYWLTPDKFAVRLLAASLNQKNNREARRESVRRHRAKNRAAINERQRLALLGNVNGRADKAREYERRRRADGRSAIATKKWRQKNLERARAASRIYNAQRRTERHDVYIAQKRAWNAANREAINAQRRENRRVNELLDLKNRLRARTAFAFQQHGYRKTSTTCAVLGAEWLEVKAHIEARFQPGMSWENRGEWHVDHAIPLASAKTEAELRALCRFTNLQPLWAKENMSKGAKLIQIAA